MFQYAFGKSLSKKLNTELFLDLTWFSENTNSTIRKFQLDIFNTDYVIADDKIINAYKPLIYRFINTALIKLKIGKLQAANYFVENSLSYNHSINRINKNCYINGYWQSEKYFLDIRSDLVKDFSLKRYLLESLDIALLNKIQSTESVAVHIRRSDYTLKGNFDIHGILPISYYTESMDIINRNFNDPYYFIFSDDIEWARNVLDAKSKNIHFVTENPNYFDFYLNSQCKHNIIANSSFSWWSAWLNDNPDKMVIAPMNWYSNKNFNDMTYDLIPELWIRI